MATEIFPRSGAITQVDSEELGYNTGELFECIHLLLHDEDASWMTDGLGDKHDLETRLFAARGPTAALEWMCRNVAKRTLLRQINSFYASNPASQDDDNESVSGTAVNDDGQIVAKSRKRRRAGEKSDTRSKKAVQKEMIHRIAGIWANIDDDIEVAGVELDEKQRAFLKFFDKYPGIGRARTAEMIKAAVTVASEVALKDWASILSLWRERISQDKNMLGGSTQIPSSQLLITDGASDISADDDNTVSRFQVTDDNLQMLYFVALSMETRNIVDTMRHRWITALVYQDVVDIEEGIEEQSGRTGVDRRSLARQLHFNKLYRGKLLPGQTRHQRPKEWENIDRLMSYGKRWNALRKVFGVGIFGALPPSGVTNSFIQRTLSYTQLLVWIELVRNCVEGVDQFSSAIEPLFMQCVTGMEPPADFYQLEGVREWEPVSGEEAVQFLKEARPPSQEL